MNNYLQEEPKPFFGRKETDGSVVTDFDKEEILEPSAFSDLTLTELRPSMVPLYQGIDTVLFPAFHSDEWFHVLVYLPEAGNRGQVWIGNKQHSLVNSWRISRRHGYSIAKVEISLWRNGQWEDIPTEAYPPPGGANPDLRWKVKPVGYGHFSPVIVWFHPYSS